MPERRLTTSELIALAGETKDRVGVLLESVTVLTQELRRRLAEDDDEGDPRDGSE